MVEPLPKEKLQSVYDKVSAIYDWQHSFFTLNSDQRGRKLLVSKAVERGDEVLDAGAGTGTTALMAAQKVGAEGRVTLYDFSEGMLNQAKKKAEKKGVTRQLTFVRGDMTSLPFEDNSFDVVLSTYSMCPLYDPGAAALELYRVVKPGGKIGVAHSTTPSSKIVQKMADVVEKIYWKVPELSLGCRAVDVLTTLGGEEGEILFQKKIGVPLWPFLVFIFEKASG